MKDILDKYYILIIILRIEWTDALVDATGSLSSWYIIIVCRCTDRSMFFIFHHRRCGSSHVPLHSSSFAVFSSQTHLFLFFSFYIIDVLDQQAGISFSRLSREDTRLDLLLYFIIIFFIIISIIDITIRFIIIDYIIIEFVLYHSARMRTKERKKKKRKKKSNFEAYVACNGNVSKRVFISCYYTECTVRYVVVWKERKWKKIEEKMSPLSLPSRLKDDSMCDKSSL